MSKRNRNFSVMVLAGITLFAAAACSTGSDGNGGAGNAPAGPSASVKIGQFATITKVEAAVSAGLKAGELSSSTQEQLVNLSGKGSDLASSAIGSCSGAADNSVSVDVAACTFGAKTSAKTIVVTGDSRAQMWFDVFNQIATSTKTKLVMLVKAGCPSAIADFSVVSGKGVPSKQIWTACSQWHDNVLTTIAKLRPAVVVNSSASTLFLNGSTGYASVDATESAFAKFFAGVPRTVPQVMLGGFPNVGGDSNPVLCLSKTPDASKCTAKIPDRVAERNKAQQDAATKAKVTFVDQSQWLCADGTCPAVVDNVIPYTVDGYRVNQEYSKYLTGVLWTALRPYVGA